MIKVKWTSKTLILLFSLIIMTGLFSMPLNTAEAGSEDENILKISQDVREESGRKDRDNYTFSYKLSTNESDCPIPDGAEGLGWDFELTGDDSIALDLLTDEDEAAPGTVAVRFGKAGIYHYILEQIGTGELVNVTYDKSVYDIYVKVVWEQSNGLKVNAVWVQRETGEKPDSIEFVNKVKSSSVIGDPPVMIEKRVEGDPADDDKFVFVMTPDQEDYPLPEGARGSFEKTLYGEGEIEIGNISFSEPGTYGYTIAEKEDPSLDYEFDRAEYRVTYKVKREKDGSLSCERDLRKKNADVKKCVFTNVYNGKKEQGPELKERKRDPDRDDRKQDPDRDGKDPKNDTGIGPKTGDLKTAAVYIMALIMAAALLIALRKRRKKE